MPRAPSEKVTQAEKLFNDGMAMVEIAKKLEVSDGTVRSWKNRYGWGKASKKNKCNVAKKSEKKNATLQKKKRGGQPKNQNAKGGSGNPNPNPPPDRTKHGGYVPVFMDALDSDEQELLDSIPEDTELQLMEQIQLFSIRERRILKAINKYRDQKGEVAVMSFSPVFTNPVMSNSEGSLLTFPNPTWFPFTHTSNALSTPWNFRTVSFSIHCSSNTTVFL